MNHEGAIEGNKVFELTISNGLLKNVKAIAAPSKKLSSNKINPIRQKYVKNVLIETNDKFAEVDLYDFRLHEWTEQLNEAIGENKANGRIKGTAYACINPGPPVSEINTKTNIQSIDNTPAAEAIKSNIPATPTTNVSPQNNVTQNAIDQNCLFCRLIPKIIISLLCALTCNWLTGLACFLGIHASCIYATFASKNGLKILTKKHRIILSTFLICAALIAIIYLLATSNCSTVLYIPLSAVLICFILSGSVSNCILRSLLCALWFIALISSCNYLNDNCEKNSHSMTSKITNHIDEIKQSASNYLPADQTSNTISNAYQGQNTGKEVTLDEALKNPDLIKDCRNKLYLPNASLFATDKSEITKDSEITLNQLSALINKLGKDTHIIITGHSDKTGDKTPQGFLHNIILSEQRATSVATWLASHRSGIGLNEIEVQGVGSKYPLIEDVPDSVYNRRVEVGVSCK